jgi:hypothetical protein
MKDVNLAAITVTELADTNTVKGVVQGVPVIVSRRLVNWTPRLAITLGGVLLHDIGPSEGEKIAFNQLLDEACAVQSDSHARAKHAVMKTAAFNTLFG